MKIAILGTRGIPNNYGGFEQCAEYLALGLAEEGHEITVYCSSRHEYKEPFWNNIELIHCIDPEYKYGTVGQFIYDLNCILDARRQNFEIILQLGYTSSSVWGWLLPKRSVITTNMDGLEWKRTKYSKSVRLFLKFAERLGVFFSNHLVSDSIGIQQYLIKKYRRESTFIPYGAMHKNTFNKATLNLFSLKPNNYYILVARMEPENSIEEILDGYIRAEADVPFVVIGNTLNKFGKYLMKKFQDYNDIHFTGAVYDINVLNDLRHYSSIYFHGHKVGGTNPSLLEAMACDCIICANDNEFNKEVLSENAYYFTNSSDISVLLKSIEYNTPRHNRMIDKNRTKIEELYNWDLVVQLYGRHFSEILKERGREL